MNPQPPKNQSDLINAATQPLPPRSAGGGGHAGDNDGVGRGGDGDGSGSGGFYHGDENAHPPDPERIGPYRIHRRLGAGGMGAVYLATREDDHSYARVALKVIKRGKDTDEIIGRFEQERRMLAALNHDNIARLLDASVTREGQPYFVMEYVDGLPIDEYCDTNRLPISKRLELFRTLCHAVHYAHQNLIVHRDIKASNVVVTPEGKVKLLDFGIAKLINPGLGFHAAAPTLTAHGPMTPEYASPEQVRGDPISTASDVYSLGVLLYELLTGRRPYRLKSQLASELIRVICTVDPERPSTAVTRTVEDVTTLAMGQRPAADKPTTTEDLAKLRESRPERLRRLLAGDIDNIVLKAMDKAPRRRYESAEQFAEDIHRHLVGLPVIARPPKPLYVIHKFVERNKGPVLAAAAIVFLLVGGLITAFVLMQEAKRQRNAAEQAKLAEQQLREAAEKLRDQFEELANHATTALFSINQHLAGASSMTVARALTLEERNKFLERLQRFGNGVDLRAEWARAYLQKGDQLGGGTQSANLGKRDEAIAEYRKAIPLLHSLLTEQAHQDEATRQLVFAHYKIAHVQTFMHRFDEAGTELGKADQLIRTLDPQELKTKRLHSLVTFARGDWLYEKGEIEQAKKTFEEVNSLRDALVQGNLGQIDRELRLDLSREWTLSLNRLAGLFVDEGTNDAKIKAMELYQRALRERLRLQDDDPNKSQRQRDIAVSRLQIGTLHMVMGSFPDSVAELAQARDLIEKRFAEDPRDARLWPIRAEVLVNLALVASHMMQSNIAAPIGYEGAVAAASVRAYYQETAETYELLFRQEQLIGVDPKQSTYARPLLDTYDRWSRFEKDTGGESTSIVQRKSEELSRWMASGATETVATPHSEP